MAPTRVLAFPRQRVPYAGAEPGGSQGSGCNLLQGKTVLVVEDDFIVAFDMQTLLEEHGAQVLGPASTLDEARAALARSTPQLAVLDVNLNGEFVFPFGLELQSAGVPFVFATAYADDVRLFPEGLLKAPRLAKPVLPNLLIGQLKRLLE